MISGRDQNSLMSFTVRGVDSGDAVEKLRKRNIFTRTVGVYDPPAIRVSVGFWNRESDMDIIAEAVRSLA
jgi:selenocysteine lyase/cysteine desulfurase